MDEALSGDVIQSVLKVRVSKPALYTCLASNRHSAGANTVKASARVTVAGTSGRGQRWCFQLLGPPAVSGIAPQPPMTAAHTSLTTHTLTRRARKEQQHGRLHLQTQADSCFLSSSCLWFHPPDVPSTIFCCFLSLLRRMAVRQDPPGWKMLMFD